MKTQTGCQNRKLSDLGPQKHKEGVVNAQPCSLHNTLPDASLWELGYELDGVAYPVGAGIFSFVPASRSSLEPIHPQISTGDSSQEVMQPGREADRSLLT